MGFFAVAGQVVGLGTQVADAFGGDASWIEKYRGNQGRVCPGQPSLDQITQAVRAMPDASIQTLVQALREANNGKGPASREELLQRSTMQLWVTAVYGGGDCRITNTRFQWLTEWFENQVRAFAGGSVQYTTQSDPYSLPPGTVPQGSPVSTDLPWIERVREVARDVGEDLTAIGEGGRSSEVQLEEPRPILAGVPGWAIIGGGLALGAVILSR